MGNLLYILVVILVIAWLLGMFAFNVSSGLIHLLLVIAVIVLIVKLVGGRRGI
ncbi:MAG: lmo0937 family membrane protein [Chitinophagaceae bacterium]|nr:MAG: lmo0937 family membrane protein [Chitinophagaceae bacterium]